MAWWSASWPPCGAAVFARARRLATLSDDSAMWVHFDMPERHYLAFMTERGEDWRSPDLELILADHSKYPHTGKIVEILASFHNETGDITFLAEFPNPDGVLRRGQTGTLLIKRVVKDAILLIPRRATFEGPYLWKRYVYVVDKDHVAHRREIVIEDGADDVSVVKKGVECGRQDRRGRGRAGIQTPTNSSQIKGVQESRESLGRRVATSS